MTATASARESTQERRVRANGNETAVFILIGLLLAGLLLLIGLGLAAMGDCFGTDAEYEACRAAKNEAITAALHAAALLLAPVVVVSLLAIWSRKAQIVLIVGCVVALLFVITGFAGSPLLPALDLPPLDLHVDNPAIGLALELPAIVLLLIGAAYGYRTRQTRRPPVTCTRVSLLSRDG